MKNHFNIGTRSLTILSVLVLTACNTSPAPKPIMVGGDMDAHGCKASAGYSWCASANQCVRPWELAKSKGFELTSQNINLFCAMQAK